MLNKKWLFLALLFFVIFGLVFPFQPATAQIPGLNCAWWDAPCLTANFFLSVMIKIVVLTVFGIPLLISALFVAIMALILGWIISPDFISLSFTVTNPADPRYNPFVAIGLSITKGFANMGFILFLVVIALATVLRIEEYKAKKTLTTLIIIALLINFSPVFCGFIIDASNIVMNYFLSGITGLTGFSTFLYNAGLSIWNSLITSGFDVWANIAAAMQVVISIVFNFFAGYIFILFSLLFIMRYIMLWIIVIVSPVAFVSYILPVTKRGQSLLSWRKWWEQLISWCIIGIIAGFFLYLGFTMISMINASPGMFVTQPDLSWGGGGLGLANNILPYLIPLVLLWIAYKETKRTSAMFAGEIISTTEKIGKAAVTAAAIVATAGAGAAMGLAKGAAKGAPGAVGGFQKRMDTYATAHPETRGGHVAGWMSRRAGSIRGTQIYTDEKGEKDEVYEGWVGRRREGAEKLAAGAKKEYGEIKEGTREWIESQKNLHPDAAAIIGGMKKQVGKGLNRVVLGRGEKEGRKLEQDEIDSKELRKTVKTTKRQDLTQADYDSKTVQLPNGITRDLEPDERKKGYIEIEKEERQKVRDLTDKELKESHEFTLEQKSGLAPIFKNAMKSVDEELNEALTEEVEKRLNVISLKLSRQLDKVKDLGLKIEKGESINFEGDIKDLEGGIEETYLRLHGQIDVEANDLDDEVKDKIRKYGESLNKKVREGIKKGGITIPKISDIIKIPRRKPKKDETRPPTPTPDEESEESEDRNIPPGRRSI